MSDATLAAALSELLDAEVADVQRIAAGDICHAWRAELAGGGRLFVKSPRRPLPGMTRAEAEGLRWLSAAAALRVPAPRGAFEAEDGRRALLVMEWIEVGAAAVDFADLLGRGLADLHRSGSAGFGHSADNYIGALPQSNTPHDSWSEFYASERLEPQLRLARDAGRLSASFLGRVQTRLDDLAQVTGPEEPPARLHGDLWSGNCIADANGVPCLVDPAVYGGHREMDLAMMRLFGGFSERVFDAYAEAYPLAAGARERVPLYQLYPLLVHLNLFGGGYRDSVVQAFDTIL